MTPRRLLACVVVMGTMLTACARPVPPALPSAPAYPDVPALPTPPTLQVSAESRSRHEQAWRRLQANDLRGAARDWNAALTSSPGFYPAQAGLGFVAMQEKKWADARAAFDAVLRVDAQYVPALSGLVDAALSGGDHPSAAIALERLIALTPAGAVRDEREARLDVLRLRAVQDALQAAATARDAGRFDDARASLEQARQVTPGSPLVLREQARLDVARGAFDDAERTAREALTIDIGDAETHVVLADVLEAQGRLQEAAEAYAEAVRRDPRPEWRNRAAALTSAAALAALPAEYRALPSSNTVTRGQLAALLGIRLERAIATAPRRAPVVLTDVRRHWAATWILPVTRVGVMEALPNHTFQPAAIVSRGDLARIVWQAIQVLAPTRTREINTWRTARATTADVPRGHLAAGAIAAVMAAGAMTADPAGRFRPADPATGVDALTAVARLEQLAGGGR